MGTRIRQFIGVAIVVILSSVGAGVAEAQSKIYWTEDQTGNITRANLDGSDVEVLLTGSPNTIAIDTTGRKMYWIEMGSIFRANLDGSAIEQLVTGSVSALSLNEVARTKYWIENGSIFQASLDASTGTALLTGAPTSIAVDGTIGKIYWIEGGTIFRANLDGSAIESLLTGSPSVIAVDGAGGKIYWIELGNIWRANLDGSAFEELLTGSADTIALDKVDGKIYFSKGDHIRRANLDGTVVEDLVGGLPPVLGLAIDHPDISGRAVFPDSLGGGPAADFDFEVVDLSKLPTSGSAIRARSGDAIAQTPPQAVVCGGRTNSRGEYSCAGLLNVSVGSLLRPIVFGTANGISIDLSGVTVLTSRTQTVVKDLDAATTIASGSVSAAIEEGTLDVADVTETTVEVFETAAVLVVESTDFSSAASIAAASSEVRAVTTDGESVPELPDFSSTPTKLKHQIKTAGDKVTLKLAITNNGTAAPSDPLPVTLWLSDDAILDAGDTVLETAMVEPEKLSPGATTSVKVKQSELDSIGGKFAIIDVNTDGAVAELTSLNNVAAHMLGGRDCLKDARRPEKEPNDTPDDAQQLQNGAVKPGTCFTIPGSISTGDIDIYRLPATQPQTWEVTLTHSDQADFGVRLFDTDETEIEGVCEATETSEQCMFVLEEMPEDSTWTLMVEPATGEGTYTLDIVSGS